jgi:hypothetical protein
VKRYRPPGTGAGFRFPFRLGGRSLASGKLNVPPSGRPSKSIPPIKQFTKLGDPQRRKQKGK